LVGETVFVTVTVKELVLLVVMVGENEGDTVRTTPVVVMLVEIPDPAPEVTEILEEIADAAPTVVVILGERPPAPVEML